MGGGRKKASRPRPSDDIPVAAEVIAAAYRDHPGRMVDREVQNPDNAARFLALARSDGYGLVQPPFIRVSERKGALVGVAVGAQAAPGVGFLLQLAVAPNCQGHSVGKTLLHDVGCAFRQGGYCPMALGVLSSNPVRGFYTCHGFTVLRDVNAYLWDCPGV